MPPDSTICRSPIKLRVSNDWISDFFRLECPEMVFYGPIGDLMQNPIWISVQFKYFTCHFYSFTIHHIQSLQLFENWFVLTDFELPHVPKSSHSRIFSFSKTRWLAHVAVQFVLGSSNLFSRLFALCLVYQRLDVVGLSNVFNVF